MPPEKYGNQFEIRIEVKASYQKPFSYLVVRPVHSIHSHHYRHVIEKLVEARIAAGMTQMAMAKAWGRNQSIIAKIETCERRIDVVEFLSLCRLVNLDPIPVLQQVQAAMASE